jgi:hypothetical protein
LQLLDYFSPGSPPLQLLLRQKPTTAAFHSRSLFTSSDNRALWPQYLCREVLADLSLNCLAHKGHKASLWQAIVLAEVLAELVVRGEIVAGVPGESVPQLPSLVIDLQADGDQVLPLVSNGGELPALQSLQVSASGESPAPTLNLQVHATLVGEDDLKGSIPTRLVLSFFIGPLPPVEVLWRNHTPIRRSTRVRLDLLHPLSQGKTPLRSGRLDRFGILGIALHNLDELLFVLFGERLPEGSMQVFSSQ